MNPQESIPLLDKGHIHLVDIMGSDLSIVRAARVSYDAAWRAGEDEKNDTKLIKYLWNHQHTTPFEAATLSFEVKAPIFVFRQWHRHRTQSYNEVSARYTVMEDEFYVPGVTSIGVQSTSSKQARVMSGYIEEEYFDKRVEEIESYKIACQGSFFRYHELIKAGWPRELARMCLPFSTYSKMFTTMNLLNCFKFLHLRLHPHAQYEIRVYAEAILKLIEPHFPVSVGVFKEWQDKQKTG